MNIVDKSWTFPAGERGVKVNLGATTRYFTIDLRFNGSDSLVDMLLTVDALRREYGSDIQISLNAPYFPYARQDRKMQAGESHSLKVIADLVNSCNFYEVHTADPHSDVVEALVNNLKILPQYKTVLATILDMHYDFILAPDAGALKKVYKLSSAIGVPVICATKTRDVYTGTLSGTVIAKEDYNKMQNKNVLVADDICDGGGTFTALAKVLPNNCTKDLYVTHGVFSKGKEILLADYRNIFCYNDMSTQRKELI